MSMPPLPPPLEALQGRPFSFYPPIINVEHNEWQFRKATWSEILVHNPKGGLEIWIPRRFLGEISAVDEPVVIVGLLKELEFRAGSVWPYQRRVIQMPVAVGQSAARPAAPNTERAPVVGIRVETSPDSRILRLVGGSLVVSILLYFAVVAIYRGDGVRQKVRYRARDESFLELTARDDYYTIVNRFGPPAADRWQSESGTLQYRALAYPQRSFTVVLMGTDRKSATYIGTMSENWTLLHSTNADTASMLRGLKKF